MKKCKCGGKLVVESLGDRGDVRQSCAKCGLSEVKDNGGRKLLTSESETQFGVLAGPSYPGRLVEG